jgi:hypothetical protein
MSTSSSIFNDKLLQVPTAAGACWRWVRKSGCMLFQSTTQIIQMWLGRKQLWVTSPILEERLLQADWCPGEVKRLSAGMNVCNQYLASLLARSGSTSHEQCSTDFCSANQITGKFAGKHTAWCEGTRGTCRGIGPSPEKVVEILKQGGIAVIEISTGPETGNLTLNVVKAGSAPGYTAVSDIWSDGLGDLEQNELYACHLHLLIGFGC